MKRAQFIFGVGIGVVVTLAGRVTGLGVRMLLTQAVFLELCAGYTGVLSVGKSPTGTLLKGTLLYVYILHQ